MRFQRYRRVQLETSRQLFFQEYRERQTWTMLPSSLRIIMDGFINHNHETDSLSYGDELQGQITNNAMRPVALLIVCLYLLIGNEKKI